MYAVSNAYKTAMAQPVHRFKISGYVGSTAFTEANILQGTLSITNKCSNGNDIVVGSVNIGVLKCTFIGMEVSENDDITLSEGLKLANNTYEYVPMGVYRVAEANVTKSGIVVTAYDRMNLFDKNFEISTTYGTPYAIANLACQTCGVVLGMTIEEMQALPNGTESLMLASENDIQTWRDMIFWLAQAMACIATINRSGNLVFRPFKQSSDNTLTNYQRFNNSSFSRFVVRYSGISVVNVDDKTTSYYGLDDDRYLTYNIGANPFLQSGTVSDRTRMRTAVLNGIANIAYTPFKVNVNVGALYDLGDVITNTDGLATGSSIACVMRYEWKLNRGFMMEGVGKNPALASAKSKADKQIQGIEKSQQSDTVQYYIYTNAESITVPDGDRKKIIDIRFISSKKTIVLFNAEILVDADTEDKVAGKITYRYNDVYIEGYNPTETMIDGEHVLHLLYPFEIDAAKVSRIEVFLDADGGSLTIPIAGIKAAVYGQGLIGTSSWDGTIEIRQKIDPFNLAHPMVAMQVARIEESVTVATQDPEGASITEALAAMILGHPMHGLMVLGVTEDISAEMNELS